MSNLFELKLEDSPFPQAMDVYYEQLAALVGSPSKQKVALVSNISSFPIKNGTRLFNKYVSRAFADRAIERGSPANTGGDLFLGPAGFADQFSSQYGVLLMRAISDVDLRMPTEQRNEIELSRRRVAEIDVQIEKLYDDVVISWTEFRDKAFPGKTDDQLIMERISWFSSHRFARKLGSYLADVDRELTLQQQIAESVGTPETSLIYTLRNNYLNSVVYYCKVWELEISEKLNELHMSDPLKLAAGGSKGWADEGKEIDVITDFEGFLNLEGARAFTLSKQQQAERVHERTWGASASGWYGFFSATANASEHSRLEQSLKNSMEIKFGFERIDQLWVRRGDWYSAALFGLEPVKTILKKDKQLAARLKYVVSSIIVARGLKLSIKFEREEESNYFHEFSGSGSGSFLGIIPIGGGSTGSKERTRNYDKLNKTVEFIDNSKLTRILGFTVEPLHTVLEDKDLRTRSGRLLSQEEVADFLNASYSIEPADATAVAQAFLAGPNTSSTKSESNPRKS